MGSVLKTAPTVEPVELEEVKSFLRYTGHDADDFIEDFLIKSARKSVENFIRRALINQTWYYFTASPVGRDAFELPKPPISSITEVKYVNDGDDPSDFDSATTLNATNYYLDTGCVPQKITLTESGSWPTTQNIPNAMRVEYVCGYGAARTDVPEDIRNAILLICSHYFNTRDLVSYGSVPLTIPDTVTLMLNPYKIHYF